MSKESNIAIRVENLHKSFSLVHDKSNSLKSSFIKPFKKNKVEVQKVLDGVSFEIKKGEFFGIVGKNGSGKSTLLKLLAGIYEPDRGSVKVNGKLIPFIELGVGFNPELSGRDNVYLNGALLGFSRKEMDAMYDEIVDFAELHDHMEKKLKNYSSGMQVRLAFSIAIRAKADILVLDEVLAVGDETFQRKCYSYFEQIKMENKTVILVTHNMDSVRKLCNRAMLVNNGIISALGNPSVIADQYYGLNLPLSTYDKNPATNNLLKAKIISKNILDPKDVLEVEISYAVNTNEPVFAKAYIDHGGFPLMATNPKLLGWDELITNDDKKHIILYSLSLENFNQGEYKLIVQLEALSSNSNIETFGNDGQLTFKIVNPDSSSSAGMIKNTAEMKIINK